MLPARGRPSPSRRIHRGAAASAVAGALVAGACTWLGGAAMAEASVQGKRGLEIQGARDRRGFWVGSGLGFGGTFFDYDDFIPAMRLDLALGGGVSRNVTLGVDLHVTPYLTPRVGVGFGGDIEGTCRVAAPATRTARA
jgi:hypothetical protein